jgi:predicted metal-dependent HD superfamily phosphohydrolase
VLDLVDAWLRALPADVPAAPARLAGTQLLARWHQPHRRYHTVDHLITVLRVVDEYAYWATDADAVRLAAWFHDAVYDPGRVDNEEASALLAKAELPSLNVTGDRVAEVARLVRLTAGHDPLPGDRNGALLTDADLAILAAAPASYQEYAVAVRAEYGHLSDAEFGFGRAAVLEALLSQPRLFRTPALRQRCEQLARANLGGELAELGEQRLPA